MKNVLLITILFFISSAVWAAEDGTGQINSSYAMCDYVLDAEDGTGQIKAEDGTGQNKAEDGTGQGSVEAEDGTGQIAMQYWQCVKQAQKY